MEHTERPHAGGAGLAAPPQGARRERSRWWYLAPLFLAIPGGVLAYFAIRRDNPRRARMCLYLGAAVTAACIAVEAAVFLSPGAGP